MLLIMCNAGENRYAIDSRHVSEVLPQVNLHRLTGSPPWLAGMLIYRGAATPVVDLTQLTEGMPCPNRLSSRIVVLQTELRGIPRRFGVLAERVGLREMLADRGEPGRETAGPAALGKLGLDDQGIFQLVDIALLLPEDRQAILFPTVEEHR
jgi:chemotaxis-related protein WspB